MATTSIIRLTGGLDEVLELPGGRGLATRRGEPFEVPDEVGQVLVEDKTGRFRKAPQAAARAARGGVT